MAMDHGSAKLDGTASLKALTKKEKSILFRMLFLFALGSLAI
jgi:hypothetical protein